MRPVRSAHVWGQFPAVSEGDGRIHLASALTGWVGLSVDMSGACPQTRPEGTA